MIIKEALVIITRASSFLWSFRNIIVLAFLLFPCKIGNNCFCLFQVYYLQ